MTPHDGIYRLTNEAITSAPNGNNGSVSYGLILSETGFLARIEQPDI